MKEITRKQAEIALSGMAIVPGFESMILESMGYKIVEPRLSLKYLINRSRDRYTYWTVDGLDEAETENFLVAAGPVIGKYTGRTTLGIGKWRELWLEFARKDSLDKVVSLEMANLPITASDSTEFNSRNCSIIGARIDVVGRDMIDANYLDPKGNVLEKFRVDLNEKYQQAVDQKSTTDRKV
ncbi:hypothetical protein FJZ18_00055 [Candidatus Pacearchaeota archaeon]|nr:hypothetical protein [Candidatus Pacearchaeota archaeon]